MLSNSICSNLFDLSPREPPWRSHHPRFGYPSTLAPSPLRSPLSISSQRPGHWAFDGLATQNCHQEVRNRGYLAMCLAPSGDGPDSLRKAYLYNIFSTTSQRSAWIRSEAGRINPHMNFRCHLPRLMTGGGVVACSLAVRGDHLHSSHILVP